MKRTLVFKIAIVFTITSLLAEILIRLTGIYYTYSEKAGLGFISLFDVNHSGSNYFHLPNQKIFVEKPEFSYEHTIDKYGFRNKNSDATSIYDYLIFGDSFTEGLGAPDDSTMPALLSKLMDAAVYNAGVMGSDPVYAYKNWLDNYPNIHTRNVLLVINMSDVGDIIIRGGLNRFSSHETTNYKPSPWYLPLYRCSHLFRTVLHFILRFDYMFNSPWNRNTNTQSAIDTIINNTVKFQQLCQGRNQQLLVLIHPLPQEYFTNIDSRITFSKIDELEIHLKKQQIQCINLRNDFEKNLPTTMHWQKVSWKTDGHFNSKGYFLFASIIDKKLKKTKVLN